MRSEGLATAALEFIKGIALHLPLVLSSPSVGEFSSDNLKEGTAPPAGRQQDKAVGPFLGQALVANETADNPGARSQAIGNYKAGAEGPDS